jgi:hypothetical protein
LKKAFHARVGVVTDLFNELHTGHYATNASGLSLQTKLQGVTKKSSEQAASGAKRKILARNTAVALNSDNQLST